MTDRARADGQRILDRTLAALGGRERLRAVRGYALAGSVEAHGGFPGRYDVWARAPDMIRVQWDIGVFRVERGFDGRCGWERIANVRELAGAELERLRRRALFQPLLQYADAGVPVEVESDAVRAGVDAHVIRFRLPDGQQETFYVAARSALPLREVRRQPYEEGLLDVAIDYADYRMVAGLVLPFAIVEALPDHPLRIVVDHYTVDENIDDRLFAKPEREPAAALLEVMLSTVPHRIFKEGDAAINFTENDSAVNRLGYTRRWGLPFGPTESWGFDVVVNERYGRHLEPVSATIALYSRSTCVKTIHAGPEELFGIVRFPVSRFSPEPEVFDLRHHFSEPAALDIDRILYDLELKTSSGTVLHQTLTIPLRRYEQRAKLIFPIRGKFIVEAGHDFNELHHRYERSQQYAYDIVGLGPNFEYRRESASDAAESFAWGVEVLAPAGGTVVYARNDICDTTPVRQYLKMPEPTWAIGGNCVVIDHGTGEFSFLAHMQQGSIRVVRGDSVAQGQVIGLIGSSGSPGYVHLHYHLQDGPDFWKCDGLPSVFDNLRAAADWMGPIKTPKRGVFAEAV